MRISKSGLVEIESSEGFSSRPYLDTIASPARWTIGFGETDGITSRTPVITRAQAEVRLKARFEKDYAWALKPFVELVGFTQNMYDALASFIWNCGTGAVGTSTKVGRLLRQRKWTSAANAMLDWCKAGGKTIPGLLSRRERERTLFLKKASEVTSRVLTKWELERVNTLRTERAVKERHGGWDKVAPVHLRAAAKAKAELKQRAAFLEKQPNQGKAYRRERAKYIRSVIAAV